MNFFWLLAGTYDFGKFQETELEFRRNKYVLCRKMTDKNGIVDEESV